MIFPILGVIAALTFAIWLVVDDHKKDPHRQMYWAILPLTIFPMALGLFGLLIGIYTTKVVPKKWERTEVTSLATLKGTGSVGGNFFLGSGQVGPAYYYYYRVGSGNGPYNVYPRSSANSSEFEEDRKDAEMWSFSQIPVDPIWYIIAVPTFRERYEFHVPQGSIDRSYKLQ